MSARQPIVLAIGTFPEPPASRLPWIAPPTTLAASVTATIDRVFSLGLADPRGCEYRSIQVETGSVWAHQPLPLWTNGWVLPLSDNVSGAERWAIGWNGLIYPVASMGPPVDLASDVYEMIRFSKELPDQRKYISGHGKIGSDVVIRYRDYYHHGISEKQNLDCRKLTPLRAFLVFRYGRIRLAEEMWQEYYRNCDNIDEDPFLNITLEWLWNMWDRAICAHMRGDDRIALFSLRQLLPLVSICEAGWEGCRLPSYRYTKDGFEKPKFFFFADKCSTLLLDQERRNWEKSAVAVSKELFNADLFKIASPSDDISTASRALMLVRSLDQVQISQDGQPGGLDYSRSPLVRELTAIGEEAVDPLLDCLEFDTRLTRSIYFGRDFHPGREFLEVAPLAQYILSGIFKANSMVPKGDSLPTRSEYVKAVRAFREKFHGVPISERCFMLLADDTAGFNQWVESAMILTSRSNREFPERSGWRTLPAATKGPPPPMVGESLRERTDPSVSSLFEKRCRALLAMRQNYRNDRDKAYNAERHYWGLITYWAKWEPERLVYILQEFATEKLPSEFSAMYEEGSMSNRMSTMIFSLASIANDAGNEDAMSWITSYLAANRSESGWGFCVARFLANEHESPAVQKLLRLILEDQTGPWGIAYRKNIDGGLKWWSGYSQKVVRLVAPQVPFLIQILTSAQPMGTAKIGFCPDSFGDTAITLDSGFTYTDDRKGKDYFWPKYDDEIRFSVGDWLCQWFGDVTATARFRIYWPAAVKEYARKSCLAIWFGSDS